MRPYSWALDLKPSKLLKCTSASYETKQRDIYACTTGLRASIDAEMNGENHKAHGQGNPVAVIEIENITPSLELANISNLSITVFLSSSSARCLYKVRLISPSPVDR
jgi:hypothetical protein